MQDFLDIPPFPPRIGVSSTEDRFFLKHQAQKQDAENPHLQSIRRKDKGIHKLMRSGTFKGKIAKLFYKLIVDPWYK